MFKVNKNSWHYKLLAKYDPVVWPQDFCTYWRSVILFLLFFLLLAIAVLAALGIIIYTLGSFVYIAIVAPLEAAKISAIVLTALAIVSLPFAAIRLSTSLTKPYKQPSPSLLATKYHSWKHKYCPAIEYENNHK